MVMPQFRKSPNFISKNLSADFINVPRGSDRSFRNRWGEATDEPGWGVNDGLESAREDARPPEQERAAPLASPENESARGQSASGLAGTFVVSIWPGFVMKARCQSVTCSEFFLPSCLVSPSFPRPRPRKNLSRSRAHKSSR